jgi:hypothetical protein
MYSDINEEMLRNWVAMDYPVGVAMPMRREYDLPRHQVFPLD